MFRTDAALNDPALPTPATLGAEEFYKDGVSAGGDGTTLAADMLNMIQESLIAILDDVGQAHSKTDYQNLYTAIGLVIDQRIAATAQGIQGSISGFHFTGKSEFEFDISPGQCRDIDDTQTITIPSTLVDSDVEVAWNEDIGVTASSLLPLPAFNVPISLRIFAMGKSSNPSAYTLGCDTSTGATNLKSDATGAGWDKYRQVGWAYANLWHLTDWLHSTGNPNLWFSGGTVRATSFSTTPSLHDLFLPPDGECEVSFVSGSDDLGPNEDVFTEAYGEGTSRPGSAAPTGVHRANDTEWRYANSVHRILGNVLRVRTNPLNPSSDRISLAAGRVFYWDRRRIE